MGVDLELSRKKPKPGRIEQMHLSVVEVENSINQIPLLYMELSELKGEHTIVAQKDNATVGRTRFDP